MLTLGQPSCFPAMDGMSAALTFEKSQCVRRSSIRWSGRFGCYGARMNIVACTGSS